MWELLHQAVLSIRLAKGRTKQEYNTSKKKKKKKITQPRDLQEYVAARCVAMVKQMTVLAPDYSVCFPKLRACTHARTHTCSSSEISCLIAVVLRVKLFKCKCKKELHYQKPKDTQQLLRNGGMHQWWEHVHLSQPCKNEGGPLPIGALMSQPHDLFDMCSSLTFFSAVWTFNNWKCQIYCLHGH